jgi:hypothetical protein
LVFVAYLLSRQHEGKRVKTGWHGMEQHVYPLTVVSASQHYKNPTQHVGLVQSGPHQQFIER